MRKQRESAETIECGASDIAWKTCETAIMKITNIARGGLGREDRKELLVINFCDLK